MFEQTAGARLQSILVCGSLLPVLVFIIPLVGRTAGLLDVLVEIVLPGALVGVGAAAGADLVDPGGPPGRDILLNTNTRLKR